MQKFRVHIKSESDEETKETLRETAYILTGLATSVNNYQHNFGYANKIEKQKWLAKANEWLNKHKTYYNENTN